MPGHCSALDEAAQVEAARQVAEKGLTVRQTEALVRRLQSEDSAKPAAEPAADPNIRRLQDDLAERLGRAGPDQSRPTRARSIGDSLQQPR